MPNHAKLLLNKVINENDTKALLRHNIRIDDMPSEIDRNTYRFIGQYAHENSGQAPSYAIVADAVEGFEYIPEVTDSYTWLAKRVKGFAAKQAFVKLFETGELERKLNELDGNEFIEKWLPNVLDSVKMRTSVHTNVGTDIKTGADKFLSEYERRKEGKSFKIWKSKFSAIGEYVSGNMYTVFGESGRGKSVFSLEDSIYAAQQGANVLIYSFEMTLYEIMVRIYTSISGNEQLIKTWYEGRQIDAGFDANAVRKGLMDGDIEKSFIDFVKNINEYVRGNIYIRAVDDEDLIDRSLKTIEADIEKTEADFVLIDPFYLMGYERNDNKTTGGGAAATSQKLRALTGRLSVVTIAITQSTADKPDKEENKTRELKIPERADVKKTSSLLEDASILIGVDSDYKQGIGIVANLKGRDGGEGNVSNVIYTPQYGMIYETEVGEEAMKGFDF